MTERVAYFNGQIVPESQVLIPFRDRSFKYGDGVFDMTRTFGIVTARDKHASAALQSFIRFLRQTNVRVQD